MYNQYLVSENPKNLQGDSDFLVFLNPTRSHTYPKSSNNGPQNLRKHYLHSFKNPCGTSWKTQNRKNRMKLLTVPSLSQWLLTDCCYAAIVAYKLQFLLENTNFRVQFHCDAGRNDVVVVVVIRQQRRRRSSVSS